MDARPLLVIQPRRLTTCGIVAPALYVGMTLFVGLLWNGYSVANHTISELSAIGAPTRSIWIALGTIYSILLFAFGWVVWRSAAGNRALRVVGVLLMAHAVFGLFWPPMHQRSVLAAGGGTLTDTLHIVWTAVTGVLFMLETGFGAAALGTRFRVFSLAAMVVGLVGGFLTGTYAAAVQGDLPTPGVGLWERISTTVYMLWIAVLATALLKTRD